MQRNGAPGKQNIYQILRNRISLLEYAPGHQLNERDLASEFGVSRTPIRAALQKLEHEALISSHQGRGTVVTSIELGQLRDIYALRIKLTEAIGETPTSNGLSDKIAELEDVEKKLTQFSNMPNPREFALISNRIHRVTTQLTDNSRLREILDSLYFQSARFWFEMLSHLEWDEETLEMLDEVRMIKRCLQLNDIPAAAAVRRVHLSLVLSRFGKIENQFLKA